jgi:hypothetical protein
VQAYGCVCNMSSCKFCFYKQNMKTVWIVKLHSLHFDLSTKTMCAFMWCLLLLLNFSLLLSSGDEKSLWS